MADQIAVLANKKALKKGKQLARKLCKLLRGDTTVMVTLSTGSVYTMVKMDSDSGLRFSGLSNGRPGRFHIGMVKDIQIFSEVKESEEK
ncbi:MAG: hypothetical protein ABIO63_08975 [Casimicrobiaceae bacterium]